MNLDEGDCNFDYGQDLLVKQGKPGKITFEYNEDCDDVTLTVDGGEPFGMYEFKNGTPTHVLFLVVWWWFESFNVSGGSHLDREA